MNSQTTKKRICSLIVALLIAVATIVPVSLPASAATMKYAYSVGVDHESNGDTDLSGDFTGNVDYASTCYGMISGFSSYYTNNPSVAYLKTQTNPNGTRKLASDIVFLNAHGNYNVMAFGDSLGSGVYYGANATGGSYTYAGLTSISTMSTVDLISFVGCKTAYSTSNLASVAYNQGATTSIGFTDNINSRNTNGPRWLERFHDYLCNGYTVSKSISYATADVPNSNLGTYIKVYGSSSNILSSSSTSNFATDTTTYNLDGVEEKIIANSINRINQKSLNTVISIAEDAVPSLDASEYVITTNMFADDGQTGFIKLTYCIGEQIETNCVYIIIIENGEATSVISNSISANSEKTAKSYSTESDIESILLDAVSEFESQSQKERLSSATENISRELESSDTLIQTTEGYYYDYDTNELTYVETSFYESEGEFGVIYDNSLEWVLYNG